MKKITLLFTLLLSINALTGMKHNLEPDNSFPLDALPIEAKASVVQAILTYDNLDDIINTIETTKLINRQFNSIVKNVYGNYNNIKEFTALVHSLSDKFPQETTEAIAKKFAIPIAQKYVELGKKLLISSMPHDTKQAIEDGADVNFTMFLVDTDQIITPVLFAIMHPMPNVELLKLLFDAGIKTKTQYTLAATCKKIMEARGIQ